MDEIEKKLSESKEKVTEYLDAILDASIIGDYKTVKKYAKKIREQAIADKISISN